MSTTTTTCGQLVIDYTLPTDGSWQAIIAVKKANPGLKMAVVVDVNNGPGSSAAASWSTGIKAFQSEGILVYGYVYSSYGARAASAVIADASSWKQWYAPDAIFIDEMATAASFASYYKQLQAGFAALGFVLTMGNPGAPVASALRGIFTVLNTSETGAPPSSLTAGDSYIANAQGPLPASIPFLATASWVYITNSDAYTSLPSYFAQEAAAIAAASPVVPAPQPPAAGNVALNVVVSGEATVSVNGKQVYP